MGFDACILVGALIHTPTLRIYLSVYFLHELIEPCLGAYLSTPLIITD